MSSVFWVKIIEFCQEVEGTANENGVSICAARLRKTLLPKLDGFGKSLFKRFSGFGLKPDKVGKVLGAHSSAIIMKWGNKNRASRQRA